jgi:hypothetical protein
MKFSEAKIGSREKTTTPREHLCAFQLSIPYDGARAVSKNSYQQQKKKAPANNTAKRKKRE